MNNQQNCKGGDYRERCYFHPKENNIVGVCHLCLYDKLLILANNNTNSSQNLHSIFHTKIFSFGSLIHRFEFRHRKHSRNSGSEASTSQEDSFISIKFENNGVGSWDKGKVCSKVSTEQCNNTSSFKDYPSHSGPKTVVEHVQPRASLRWRKRIGHIFHVIRLKRSNKGSVCHVGSKLEGVKVRNNNNKGWMRNFTSKRTKE